jgi:hypothetical protein
MTKTVFARISDKMHEQLRNRCNMIGCTINDYLVGSLELVMNDSTEYELGNFEDKDEEEFEEKTYYITRTKSQEQKIGQCHATDENP